MFTTSNLEGQPKSSRLGTLASGLQGSQPKLSCRSDQKLKEHNEQAPVLHMMSE